MLEQDIEALIKTYGECKIEMQDEAQLWKVITDKMEDQGFNYSMKMYRNKWNYLKKTYYEKKKDKKINKQWPHFEVKNINLC